MDPENRSTSGASDAPAAARSWPRRMINRLEVDRAVFFALLLRFWQLSGGAVTMALIATFLTAQTQGVFYAFATLMALQSFFELGFSIVIVNVASHEWVNLRLDNQGAIVGDAAALSRLASLGRFVIRWYGAASLLFVVFVGAGGGLFLSLGEAAAFDWQAPWAALVLATGVLLCLLPLNAVLEGCNQVLELNKFRLAQAICANLAVWATILLGWGLWAPAAATTARVVCELYFLGVRYRRFWQSLLVKHLGPVIHWKTDLLPMQWRLSVSSSVAFFAMNMMVPVMYIYHGLEVNGRMGMTWTLVSTLQMATLAWVQTRVPKFGMLIAVGDFAELDRIFKRLTLISLGMIALANSAAWAGILALTLAGSSLANRLLDPTSAGLLFLATFAYHVPHCQSMYVRAHKREPFLVVGVVSSLLSGGLVWSLGAPWGPVGAAAGYLAVVALFTAPTTWMIWSQCRREH